jgi:uncharacterized protein with von Willebrand factor type A (vWA) domain
MGLDDTPAADGVPDVVGVRDDVVGTLSTFVRSLRRAGVQVPTNAALTGARALVTVGFDDRSRVRAALRAALLTRPEDVDTFDRLFAEFWRRLRTGLDGGQSGGTDGEVDGSLAPVGASDAATAERNEQTDRGATADSERVASTTTATLGVPGSDHTAELDTDGETVRRATYSPAGRPERITVDVTGVDAETLDAAVVRLVNALATMRGRRWTRSTDGRRVDVRRALRRSVTTGGAIASIPEKTRRETAPSALVLADVSRSVLDTIDRGFLVQFLRVLVARLRRSEVFFFDDEVRRVTDAVDEPTAAATVRALARAETEWGGGTRIGHAIETVRDEHPTTADHRTVVLIVSDGLEMGDVSVLEDGMTWLSRRSRAVIWLNPLAASPEYEPTAAGMAGALPFVDGLFAFTDTADVVETARQITQYGTTGPIGYQYDPRRRHRGDRTTGATR